MIGCSTSDTRRPNPLICPKAVPPGGRLRVVAPSGVVNGARVLAGAELLRAHGFSVDGVCDVIERRCEALPYLAGSDEVRAREFEAAFCDPAVDGVICARGGYGAMRLLRLLDSDALRQERKPLMGFSDITALNGYFAAKLGMASWHGPVVQSLPVLNASAGGHEKVLQVTQALSGAWSAREVSGLDVLRPGAAVDGPLLGGNLSLVHALAGSPWYPSLEGAVLFLEDVGEVAYRIDRMLTSLALRGVFDGVAAVVLGDLGGAGGRYVSPENFGAVTRALVLEITASAAVPVLSGLSIGHGVENIPLPFGTVAQVVAEGGSGRLMLRSAVQ